MKPKKIKKVLIALDYDPTAQKIAESGFLLAKSMGAKVILLHVVVDLVYYSVSYLNMGPLQLDSVADLNHASLLFLEKTKKHLGDETIQIIVMEGGFADSILIVAKNLHADIIVMGSHSQKWFENILMGSVTEKVLHHTTIPLFIIPTKKHQ
ncbi:MAG: universal stress protein [Bacteroidales bacterium]|nr:MAG: universal stress protein [Bacteroidales bacterium]